MARRRTPVTRAFPIQGQTQVHNAAPSSSSLINLTYQQKRPRAGERAHQMSFGHHGALRSRQMKAAQALRLGCDHQLMELEDEVTCAWKRLK